MLVCSTAGGLHRDRHGAPEPRSRSGWSRSGCRVRRQPGGERRAFTRTALTFGLGKTSPLLAAGRGLAMWVSDTADRLRCLASGAVPLRLEGRGRREEACGQVGGADGGPTVCRLRGPAGKKSELKDYVPLCVLASFLIWGRSGWRGWLPT